MAVVLRRWWFWVLLIVLLVVAAFTFLASGGGGRAEVSTEQFTRDVQAGRVLEVEVDGSEISYSLKGDGTTYHTRMEQRVRDPVLPVGDGTGPQEIPQVKIRTHSTRGDILSAVFQILPIILILGLLAWLVRRTVREPR